MGHTNSLGKATSTEEAEAPTAALAAAALGAGVDAEEAPSPPSSPPPATAAAAVGAGGEAPEADAGSVGSAPLTAAAGVEKQPSSDETPGCGFAPDAGVAGEACSAAPPASPLAQPPPTPPLPAPLPAAPPPAPAAAAVWGRSGVCADGCSGTHGGFARGGGASGVSDSAVLDGDGDAALRPGGGGSTGTLV